MTKEEIIDELLKGCRDYILTNFEEADELPYLKSCITYYSTFNKNKINNEDYDILFESEVIIMGWFADKYGKDTRPKMSIDTYDDLLTKFGEKYANDFLEDVQEGIYSEKQIRDTYLDTKNKKEHKSDYELADFCRGGELSEDD